MLTPLPHVVTPTQPIAERGRSCLGPPDNKKQFATHWALTTTNDNGIYSRSRSRSPTLSVALSLCLLTTQTTRPFHSVSFQFRCVVPAAVVVTNGNIWPNGFEWFFGLSRPHAIKSFCSLNAFTAHRIICDIRSSQTVRTAPWTRQQPLPQRQPQSGMGRWCHAFCK